MEIEINTTLFSCLAPMNILQLGEGGREEYDDVFGNSIYFQTHLPRNLTSSSPLQQTSFRNNFERSMGDNLILLALTPFHTLIHNSASYRAIYFFKLFYSKFEI